MCVFVQAETLYNEVVWREPCVFTVCRRKPLLTAERRKYILDVLRNEGRVIALDLSEALGVSIDTVRRDLRDLAAEGHLQPAS